MLEVIKFLFEYTLKFLSMLFTIDVGNGITLGIMMCVVFIFLPIVLVVVNAIKTTIIDELDESYDSSRRMLRQDRENKEGVPFRFKNEDRIYKFGKKRYSFRKFNRF